MSSNTVIRRLWQYRLFRFACVGVINTLTDLTILNVLVFGCGFKLLPANLVSASISIVISYFWNHSLVFQRPQPVGLKPLLRFVIITGLSILAVQTSLIYLFTHLFTTGTLGTLTGLDAPRTRVLQVNGAKLLAVAGAMAWNFLLYRAVVFKTPRAPAAALATEAIGPDG